MSDDPLFSKKMSSDPLKCGPTPSYALFVITPLDINSENKDQGRTSRNLKTSYRQVL